MNMQNIRPSKYLKYLVLPTLFGTQRTKEILVVNPTAVPAREEADHVSITVFDFAGSLSAIKIPILNLNELAN